MRVENSCHRVFLSVKHSGSLCHCSVAKCNVWNRSDELEGGDKCFTKTREFSTMRGILGKPTYAANIEGKEHRN